MARRALGGGRVPTAFGPAAWHAHEMLFGFVTAAVTGFLLTAVPNWTGHMPLQGVPLAGLVALWWAGRAAVALSAITGPLAAALIDGAFLVALACVIAREVVAGRNWRNLPVLAAVMLLAVANILMHGEPFGRWQAAALGERLGIAVVAMLIALVGGRIVPSFTANWLKKAGLSVSPAPFSGFDRAVLLIGALALAAWVAAPGEGPVHGALVVAAGLHALRLARWRGAAAAGEPLLWVLHLGYAWMAAGLALLGLGAWVPSLGGTTALHALTAGAMGTMILAVMTRATLGHTGRPLAADGVTVSAYVLVTAAALARVAAGLVPAHMMDLTMAGGIAWISAFVLFVARYGPMHMGRRT